MKFTDKERKLLEMAIAKIDGSNSFVWSLAKYINREFLGWTENTLKGVFGSLEKKGVIFVGDTYHTLIDIKKWKWEDTKIWYFTAPVNHDHYPEQMTSVSQLEDYMNKKKVAQ